MYWAADGQDGNGLQAIFFDFIASCLRKLAKTLIIVYFLLTSKHDVFLIVLNKHFAYDKSN